MSEENDRHRRFEKYETEAAIRSGPASAGQTRFLLVVWELPGGSEFGAVFVNRRLFLQGLGGACVAAPFLGSVVERTAKAQDMPAPKAPERLSSMSTE